MASAATLAIKLAGQDDGAEGAISREAAALDKLKNAASSAHAPVSEAGNRSREAGAKAGEGAGHFSKLKDALLDVGKTAAAFVAGNALMSFGHSLADQFKEVTTGVQDYGEAVRQLAIKTGASTEQASSLLLLFKEQGVSADIAERSLTKFAKGLQGVEDATDGVIPGGKTTLDVMKDLGVKIDDAAGKSRPLIDVLGDVAEKFHDMPDGTEKTARAMQLFGRAGADMIPILDLGKEGIAEAEAAAKKYGLTLSADNVAAIHKFALAHKDSDAALEGFRLKLGTAILPLLGKGIGLLNEAIPKLTAFVGSLKLPSGVASTFGVVADVFGKLKDAVKALGSGDANSFFLAISEGFQHLQGGVVGGQILDKMREITNFLFGTLPQAFDKARDALAPFGTAFKLVGDILGALAHGDLKDAEAGFGAFGATLTTAIADLGPKIVAKLGELIPQIGSWLISSREALIEKLASWAVAFIEWIDPMIPPLISKLGELASTLLAWIVEQIPPLAEKLAEWVNSFVDWATQAIPPLLAQLGNLFDALLGWLGEQAPPLLQKLIGEWLPAFILWVVQTIPPLIAKLNELLVAIGLWIVTDAVPKILEFALKIGEALVKGIIQAAEALGPALKDVIVKAITGISFDLGIFHLHGGVLEIDTPGGNLSVGARALGGSVDAGSPYVVGEAGPELFVPGSSGSIVPNSALGGRGGVTVAFYGPVYGFDDFQAKVTEAVNGAARTGHISSAVLVTG